MKSQKYPASVIKVGAVLYKVLGYECKGRICVDVDEWVVRSIQKKRGSQSQFGRKLPASMQTNDVYVNLTERKKDITWGKRSRKIGDVGWLKSIPQLYRAQFKVGDDLPYGMYTTKLAALKYALEDELSTVKWYEKKLKAGVPEDEKAEYEQELDEAKRVARAIKTRITKIRK